MFIANHYVKVNGKMFMKGERIPDGLSAEKLRWLIDTGAVHETASVSAVFEDTEETGYPEDTPETGEIKAVPDPEEETDPDTEAPEIDAMAGIVRNESEEPKKSARKNKTKKEGRKMSLFPPESKVQIYVAIHPVHLPAFCKLPVRKRIRRLWLCFIICIPEGNI